VSITITDLALLDEIRRSPGETALESPDGEPVGAAHVAHIGLPPPGWKSPFSDEEMAERRKDRTPGRPLADILRDLRARP